MCCCFYSKDEANKHTAASLEGYQRKVPALDCSQIYLDSPKIATRSDGNDVFAAADGTAACTAVGTAVLLLLMLLMLLLLLMLCLLLLHSIRNGSPLAI